MDGEIDGWSGYCRTIGGWSNTLGRECIIAGSRFVNGYVVVWSIGIVGRVVCTAKKKCWIAFGENLFWWSATQRERERERE